MVGLLALATGVLILQSVQQGSVEGHVRTAEGDGPLAGAVVRLVDLDRLTLTDESGRYTLTDVPAGERRIHASVIGYSSLEIVLTVPDGGHVSVDFLLTLRPVELPPVKAEAVADPGRDPPGQRPDLVPATSAAVVRVLDASPGMSETGIAATVMALMSSSPPSPDNILFVRGSGTALDLVLLDGAPVHAPFHIGGLLDPGLPPAVVSATRWHGGAPARFDGGLSEVLSLETRGSATGPATASAFVDLVSAGAMFGTGGGPARALVSMRGLHGGGTGAFVDGAFPQRYADALVRLELGVTEGDTLMVTGFWNRESVVLANRSQEQDLPRWGNTAGSIRYRSRLSIGRFETGVASGEFQNRLPIGATDPIVASGTTRRTRVTLDVLTYPHQVQYGFGIHLDRLGLETAVADPRPAGDAVSLLQTNSAVALAGYFDAGVRVARGLRLSAGVRGNLYSRTLGQALSPRARLEWNASSALLFTLSAGRYHQLVVTPKSAESAEAAFLASTEAQPLSVFTTIASAAASHLVVGFAHTAGPGRQLGLQGYWKTTRGLPVLDGADLRNAGFDMWMQQPVGRLMLWGHYSMAWAWTELLEGQRTNLFSGRHFLRAGAATDLPGGLRLDGDVSYGAGLEFGEIPRPGPANLSAVQPRNATAGGAIAAFSSVPGQAPVPVPSILVTVPNGSYLRLNFRATASFEARILGHRNTFSPYVKIINALDRPDALFYQFDRPTDPEPVGFGAVPILPVFGVEWRM
jgi:hypothetical protein